MSNKKISSLDSLGGTPAVGDIIPITDISDTTGSAQGTTKKVTVANLVAAAPQGDLQASNNLSDVASASTSRTNLGLGDAATKTVGTSNGNVVVLDSTGLPAVDGSQLTNVSGTDSTKLAIASNLSDLNSASTARTNLGLGTAATTASSDYATSSQGALADSATQPSDLGTAATLDVGTSANNVVQLNGSAQLPAVDGSNLTGISTAVEGTAVLSTGETGGTKFLREDGDGTCSFQAPSVDIETPLNNALRGTINPHIGAYPDQSFKVTDNPTKSVMVITDADGNLEFVTKDGANVYVNTPSARLALAKGFSVQEDGDEPDIEAVTPSGVTYSVISGDSDTKGANGLPTRQGFNYPDIGANPAPILISGGTIA